MQIKIKCLFKYSTDILKDLMRQLHSKLSKYD